MTYSDQQLDKRVLERNIKKGIVSQKELDKHLAQLPDRADNATTMGDDDDDADLDVTDEGVSAED